MAKIISLSQDNLDGEGFEGLKELGVGHVALPLLPVPEEHHLWRSGGQLSIRRQVRWLKDRRDSVLAAGDATPDESGCGLPGSVGRLPALTRAHGTANSAMSEPSCFLGMQVQMRCERAVRAKADITNCSTYTAPLRPWPSTALRGNFGRFSPDLIGVEARRGRAAAPHHRNSPS